LLNEISSYDFGGDIKIYPNPVSDVLFIESEGQIERIEIFDNMSQLIRTENLNCNNIDVSQLMLGLYLINIETDKCVFTKKFLKVE
jgi:hypothetical protein